MGEEILILLVLVLSLWAFTFYRPKPTPSGPPLPPGPKPLPIFGNLLGLMGLSPHKSISTLSAQHGPVMTLHLGSMTTVVVSSSTATSAMFKAHDEALSGRMVYQSMRLSSGQNGSIITAQPGPHWRTLRRLCASHLFAPARLDATEHVRRACLDSLVREIGRSGEHGRRPVEVGRLFFSMAFDHIGRVVLSREILESNSELLCHAERAMEVVGRGNVADFWPWMRRWDPQGIRRRMEFHVGRALEVVEGLVEERRKEGEDGRRRRREKDFLDVLLEFEGEGGEEPTKLNAHTINNLILELFMGGTDTTATTLEWAMTELLRHPAAMAKAQSELHQQTTNFKTLAERDTTNLPYINAIIKETLRLHPPLPFLVPRMATKPCTLLGHTIPDGTQILINVWRIGRDSNYWTDPLAFRPERFLEEAKGVDFKGRSFELLPFGSGRRTCPGMPLVARMMPAALASILTSFDWALPGGSLPEEVDVEERMGISLRKAVPLRVLAVSHSTTTGPEGMKT